MTRVTLITSTLAIAIVGAMSSTPTAQIDTRDRTFMTFSGPAEMPGVTLQAGTYVFKLADTASRNVVQVWDREEKNIIGQWLFVPAERPEVSQDTVVMFKETAAGRTPSVQYWFYPGERIGKEFVYPKDQALKIAQRTNQTVLSTEGEISPSSTVNSVDASGKVTEFKERSSQSAAAAPQPAAPTPSTTADNRAATSSGAAARAVEAPAPAPFPQSDRSTQTAQSTRDAEDLSAPRQVARAATLPETASPMALIGLIGLISLAGGATMRYFRRARG
jgi:hypothetical protein